jgi:hypothetical protein
MTMAFKFDAYKAAAVIAALGAASLFAACSSDNKNGTPGETDGGTGGSSNSGGKGGTAGKGGGTSNGGAAGNATGGGGGAAGGGTGGGGGAAGGGTGGSGGGNTDGGTGGAAGGGAGGGGGQQNCTGANNCYNCAPTTQDQFMNHCSDNTCIKYDNAANGVPATLPAIP